MIRTLSVALAMIVTGSAFAQEQQAGNAASTDTAATYQALIEKCDDVDALMLRARIRLQIPRSTEEAGANAQKLLDDAFALCGGGDLEGAKAMLADALSVAELGATENFGTDASTSAENSKTPEADVTVVDAKAEEKPWWKIW